MLLCRSLKKTKWALLPILGPLLVLGCARDRDPLMDESGGRSVDGGGGFMEGPGTGFQGDPETCEHAAMARTYVGCEFWPTVHPNVVKAYMDYAVVVANAGKRTAQVTIERGGQMVERGEVAPGKLQKFFLPWVRELKHFNALCDTDITQQPGPLDKSARVKAGAYHLRTTAPVTVFQFNPLQYKGVGGPQGKSWAGCDKCWPGCYSYSNDASLLLPTPALTGAYVATGYSGIATEEIRSPGYLQVTGTQDGTQVTLKVGTKGIVRAGADLAETKAGGILRFAVDRGEVIRLLGTPESDLAGSVLLANQPVQLMSGVPHIYMPADRQSSDHIEEVVLPAQTLGSRYLVARPTGPRGNAVGQVVRIFGVVDGTDLTYPAGAPAKAPRSIGAGQVVDLGIVTQDFEVTGNHHFAVATFQLGQTIVDPAIQGKGDPAQSVVASVEQYRKRYVFLAPDDYDVSFADVVAPKGATLRLDGNPVTVTPTPLGAEHQVLRIPLSAGNGGAHVLDADLPVSLQVLGYGFATSYQYPGGLDLKGIAPPPPIIE